MPVLSGAAIFETSEATADLSAQTPLALDASSVSLELVRVKMRVVESPFGNIAYTPEYLNETVSFENASLRVLPRPTALLHMHAWGDITAAADADRLSPQHRAAPLPYKYRMNASFPFFYNDAGVGDATVVGEGARLYVDGDAELFIVDAEVLIETATQARRFETGARVERSVGTPLRTDEYAFAIVRLAGASGSVAPMASHLASPSIHLQGELTIQKATGTIEIAAMRYPFLGQDAELHGDLAYTMRRADDGAFAYAIQGDARSLSTSDGRAYADVAQRAGAIAAILALVATISPLGRQLLGSALAALYSRITPDDALAHPQRARLYGLIRAGPAHLRALQRTIGVGWGTLHYHLSVLERSRLILLEREGKHTFAIAAGQRRDPGELAHRGAAARVLEAIATSSMSLTQNEIAEKLQISRQLASHHLSTLEAQGLVEAVGARPRRYSARPTTRAPHAARALASGE